MGLSVVAWSNITRIPEPTLFDADGEPVGVPEGYRSRVVEVPHPRFRRQLGEDLREGWIIGREEPKYTHFSYLGYGLFRNVVSLSAFGVPAQEVWDNPDKYTTHPLSMLVDFPDNSGWFGYDVVREIANALCDARFIESFNRNVTQSHPDLTQVLVANRESYVVTLRQATTPRTAVSYS